MNEYCDPSEAYKTVIKPSDGPVSRRFNRHVSVRITCFLINHNIRVTPNQLTLLIGLFGFLSGVAAAKHPLLGGLLVELTSILDGVDGEYARLTSMESKFGGFLDAVADRIVDLILLTGSLVYVFMIANPYMGLVFSAWIIGSSLIVSYLHCRGEASLGVDLRVMGRRVYAGRDVRLLIIAIALLLEPLSIALYILVIGLVGVLSTIYILDKMIEAYVSHGARIWTQ